MSGFYSFNATHGETPRHFGTNTRSRDDITLATPAGKIQATLAEAKHFAEVLVESIRQAESCSR